MDRSYSQRMPLRGKEVGGQRRLRGSPICIQSPIHAEGAGEQGRLKIEDATLFAFELPRFINGQAAEVARLQLTVPILVVGSHWPDR